MTTPNRVDKNLSDIFDIELTTTDKSREELALIAQQEDLKSLETQREYVKNNIVSLIEKGKEAIDEMHSIAASTEKGRDYEIFFSGLKTIVDMNKDLLDAEVAHKQPVETGQSGGQSADVINNQQIVFNGSTADLQRFLNDQKEQK